jgi:hypothetical protein
VFLPIFGAGKDIVDATVHVAFYVEPGAGKVSCFGAKASEFGVPRLDCWVIFIVEGSGKVSFVTWNEE